MFGYGAQAQEQAASWTYLHQVGFQPLDACRIARLCATPPPATRRPSPPVSARAHTSAGSGPRTRRASSIWQACACAPPSRSQPGKPSVGLTRPCQLGARAYGIMMVEAGLGGAPRRAMRVRVRQAVTPVSSTRLKAAACNLESGCCCRRPRSSPTFPRSLLLVLLRAGASLGHARRLGADLEVACQAGCSRLVTKGSLCGKACGTWYGCKRWEAGLAQAAL